MADSIATIGLAFLSTIMEGKGKKAGYDFQADRAERRAQLGRLQADLTDTTLREQLTSTLGNIEAIRSAGNVDPTSPTTAALQDRQRTLSDRKRGAALLTINSQVAEDEASAKYLRETGDYAVEQSWWQASLKAGKSIADMVP
jgi:hypothetical protein